ncbi:DNA adenine methylase [Arthrospiribacter ruber]|uniref:Dam family site-specific DNA-(Adenine-N6)-methyltransferase n=1 Tax=Arthrospiribacter ruber TaxID=2487934 RepID=A0A951J2U5_9BACT|nr:Dam family site-specific DNA-(adenine-N6)-methyltransferase [Arthrospiribacter ruber]MBW3469847.1 Dam family site-specific DNA-(adenine-N6)-methyltransferase [Arthrospiribacter ruber]
MNDTIIEIKPFLRWAGGKTWLTKEVEKFIPNNFNNYFEPFLGGGSIFIHLKTVEKIEKKAYLSDINSELINAYQVLKSKPVQLISSLSKHQNNEAYYYNLRSRDVIDPVERASKFIFLNRTSFNGIYRENMQGEYNVPYGFKQYKTLFDTDNLINLSCAFKSSFFSHGDFKKIANKIKQNDLVFIDPPYTVAHGNNGFIKYNQKIFSWKDQVRLSKFIEFLIERGAYYIMTNAHHESIIDLFGDYGDITILSRASVVGGKKAKRTKYEEIILSNIS